MTVEVIAIVRVPRPFDPMLYDDPALLKEMGLAGQVVLAAFPSRVPFWLISSDPLVIPPLPLNVITPANANFPPPWAMFWIEEPPKAKLPFTDALEKDP